MAAREDERAENPFSMTCVDKAIALIAKRNAGKSRLLRWLIKLERDRWDEVFIVSKTDAISGFYEKSGLVERRYVFEKYSDEWMGRLFERMKRLNSGIGEDKSRMKRVMVVLDDVLGTENMGGNSRNKYPNYTSAFTAGRHYGISIIVVAQSVRLLSPVVRNQCDFLCVSQMNHASKKIVCEEFLMGDITPQELLKLINRCTTNHQFLVINNTTVTDASDLAQIYGVLKTPASEVA